MKHLSLGTAALFSLVTLVGCGEESSSESINLNATGPAAPSELVVTPVSLSQLKLTWVNNSNYLGLKVERKTSEGTYEAVANLTPGSVNSYDDMALNPATQYYYRVWGYNEDGESRYSGEAVGVTLAPGPIAPSAPQNLGGNFSTCSKADLTWQAPTSADHSGYSLTYKVGSAGTYSSDIDMPADALGKSIEGLLPNKDYYFRLVALKTDGSGMVASSQSIEINFNNYGQCPPSPPVNFRPARLCPQAGVTMLWDLPVNPNYERFRIDRVLGTVAADGTFTPNTGASFSVVWSSTQKTQASWTDSTLPANQAARYRISARRGTEPTTSEPSPANFAMSDLVYKVVPKCQ